MSIGRMDEVKHNFTIWSSGALSQRQGDGAYNQAMIDDDVKEFKERLLAARDYAISRKVSVTNVGLSDLTGVTVQAIGQWFKTGKIAKRHYPIIAKSYGVSLIWLTFGIGEMIEGVTETLTSQEINLVRQFRRLTGAQRTEIINVVNAHAESNEQIVREFGAATGARKRPAALPPGVYEVRGDNHGPASEKTKK